MRKHRISKELASLGEANPDELNLSPLVGKLVFAGRGLCGRAGAHARRPLYWALRNYSLDRKLGRWPTFVKAALSTCLDTVVNAPPRDLPLRRWGAPVAILYCDAAISTRRMGGMLLRRSGSGQSAGRAFSVVVPEDFLAQLGPSANSEHAINGFEACCVFRACEFWG